MIDRHLISLAIALQQIDQDVPTLQKWGRTAAAALTTGTASSLAVSARAPNKPGSWYPSSPGPTMTVRRSLLRRYRPGLSRLALARHSGLPRPRTQANRSAS